MQPQLLYYPFLREIPEADLALLDLQVLAIPGPAEKALLQQLSATLNKNIVLYNTLYQPKGGHLCRYLKFAALSEAELQTILEAEGKIARHQAIVAYESPLTFA